MDGLEGVRWNPCRDFGLVGIFTVPVCRAETLCGTHYMFDSKSFRFDDGRFYCDRCGEEAILMSYGFEKSEGPWNKGSEPGFGTLHVTTYLPYCPQCRS